METAAIALVTFTILSKDMDAFRAAFAKLVKKAAKLGVAEPTYTVIEADKVLPPVTDAAGKVTAPGVVVTVLSVSGQAPKLAGWTFVAALQHTSEGNVVRTVPGIEPGPDAKYRTTASVCDHCKLQRNRKDTYVVRHDDGRELQVGRSCLKDFTGHKNPEAIARWAELLSTFVGAESWDGEGGGFGGAPWTTTTDFLAQVVHEIGMNGWVSRTRARDAFGVSATADEAWGVLFMTRETEERLGRDRVRELQFTAADIEKAKEALAYAAAYFDQCDADGTELGDYEWNLRIAVAVGGVDWKTAGIVASLIPWWERKLGREVARQKVENLAANSKHVGTVKQRLVFKGVIIEKVFDWEGDFGWTYQHIMRDAEGNRLVWKSSSKRLDPGSTVDLKGTVKEHGEYKGVAQTVLTRCAVLD